VAEPLEEVDIEVRPGVVGRFQVSARDKARLIPPDPAEPARKARPVAANKAAGTAPTK
jgi:hypothetical protein